MIRMVRKCCEVGSGQLRWALAAISCHQLGGKFCIAPYVGGGGAREAGSTGFGGGDHHELSRRRTVSLRLRRR